MPNPFFTNSTDLLPNTRARAGDVESKLEAVEAGFDLVNEYATRALRGPLAGAAVAEMPSAASRANKVLVFDASGNPGVATPTDSMNAVNRAGDTMTGNLSLPSINGGQLAGLRNKIINGKMDISQRGTSFAAITDAAYCLDRWYVGFVTSAVVTATQQADAPSGNEFLNSLRLTVTTADASIAAGDYFALVQPIEGQNVREFIGRSFTTSFWVRSSKTGVHCVAFRNSGKDRSYIAEYTVNTANTWEKKTVTVPAGLITAGTWDWAAGVGLYVNFALAAGSTRQTTKDAWQTGDFFATSSQVNCLDTIGNIFAVTGIQVEPGAVDTPFEHRLSALESLLCRRYYFRTQFFVGYAGFAVTTTVARFAIPFLTFMRAFPTALEQSGTAANYIVTRNGGGTVTSNAVPTFIGATDVAATVALNFASGLVAGEGLQAQGAAGSFFGFSAEL